MDTSSTMLSSYANVDAKPCMAGFRWVMFVLDLFYLGLARYQRSTNKKFPSERFDDFRSIMIVHVICGIFIIYGGCLLQLGYTIFPWTEVEDKDIVRKIFYYIFALFTIVHSGTVLKVFSKVMGEKRITVPLYVMAGSLNLFNAVNLIIHPTVESAFLVWGSVNTFIFVRLNMIGMAIANIDWELSYTYAIIAAAAVTYPMTNQPTFIYYLGMVVPLVYAPFHERLCDLYGWETEDTIGGNAPSEKNISSIRKNLRKQLALSVIPKKNYGSTGGKTVTIVEEENDVESLDEFLPSLRQSTSRQTFRQSTISARDRAKSFIERL